MMAIRTIKVARIFYRTDAGRTDAEELPLGVLAFVQNARPKAEMLVLIAREQLDPSWDSKMNPVAKLLLANPASFFKAEINAAMEDQKGDFLTKLAAKFSYSISISAPTEVKPSDEITAAFESFIKGQKKSPDQSSLPAKGRKRTHRILPGLQDEPSDQHVLMEIAGPALRGTVAIDGIPPAWVIAAPAAISSSHM